MPRHPKRLLRGLVKLAGVVLAAGLAGAGAGIGLAKLTGGEESGAPDVAATNEATTGAADATGATATVAYREPRIEVLTARLGPASPETGRARLLARVRVTNRNPWPLRPRPPLLTTGPDELALDGAARDGAGPLLRAIAPDATATGELRFTLPAAVVQRVRDRTTTRLQIAGRTLRLNVAVAGAVE